MYATISWGHASSLSVLRMLSASQSVHYRRFDCIVIHANPRMYKTVAPYVTSCLLSALKHFLSASCLEMNFQVTRLYVHFLTLFGDILVFLIFDLHT